MSLQIKPANEYAIPQLADLLTRGFEGYFVPIHITEPVLWMMMRRDGIDPTASRVILKDGEPVGVALIARRGWTSRLAAMGIVQNARHGGVGTFAMENLIREAKERGEKQMILEVIAQNTAGVKLYEKHGFKKMRNLFGYKIENPQVESTEELEEVDIRELAGLIAAHGMADLPWQLSAETIAHHTPPAKAFRLGDAYCLISAPGAEHAAIASVLVKAGSRRKGLGSGLMRAAFVRFPNTVWHVPAIYPEEFAPFFENLNMNREDISQFQMTLEF